jgi:hypothetical protein
LKWIDIGADLNGAHRHPQNAATVQSFAEQPLTLMVRKRVSAVSNHEASMLVSGPILRDAC